MKTMIPTLLLTAAACVYGQNLADIEKRVTEFTLPNGLHFILLERHDAPVVSFVNWVNAGSVDDPSGAMGIAHMFEHMAFKGTAAMGSKNYAEEAKALDAVEKAYEALNEEKRKGARADAARQKQLNDALQAAIKKADSYVDKERYSRILEEAGVPDLNAGTGVDQTMYFSSLPSNRAELWFLMESERLARPVFREFYSERSVVREEYRQRIESNPQGKLINVLLNSAFAAHPYRVGPAGFPDDIENFRAGDAMAFRRKYYVPSNMTIAMAGDIDAKEARRLAEKYFSRIPAGPLPGPVVTKETPQEGEKRVAVETPAQPMVAFGYKRPNYQSADDPAFDVIAAVLNTGRTSLLYKELVEKQIALGSYAGASFPGQKYDTLFIFFVVPNMGKTTEECEKAVYDIIENLKKKPLDAATLQRVKTNLRAGLIRQLNSNMGMAQQLAAAHTFYGNWRKFYDNIADIEKVSAADVQRVATKYFVPKQRTVAYTVKPSGAPAEGGQN
jgi:predicted Zn-dependent peptidase